MLLMYIVVKQVMQFFILIRTPTLCLNVFKWSPVLPNGGALELAHLIRFLVGRVFV